MAIFKVKMIIEVNDDIFEDGTFTIKNFEDMHSSDEIKTLYENMMNLEPNSMIELSAECIEE